MSSDVKQIGGALLVLASYAVPIPGAQFVMRVAGAYLLYDGAKQAAKEAEKEARFRANQERNSRDIKANIRSSSETHLLCFGKVRVGGIIVAMGTGGTGTIHIGIAHSICHAGGCEGVSRIWINDDVIEASEYSGDPLVTEATVTKARYVYSAGSPLNAIKFQHYRGTGTQTADATMVTALLPNQGGGSTAHRRGIAWTRFTLDRSTNDAEGFERAFPSGVPSISVELKANRCYDPRLDSTEGGSGSHRKNNVLTWEWTRNSALIAATYMIMDVSDGGMGVATSRIDWDSVAAAANICDETLTNGTGSPSVSQARYSCNIALNTADSREVNLRKILDTMQGQRVRVGDKYKLYAGAFRSPTFTLDQSYLRGGAVMQTRSPLDELYNAVRVVHDDEDQSYRSVEAPPFTSAAYEANDGGERLWREEAYPGVSSTFQAQYIAAVLGEQSRKQKTLELPCNLKALDIECWETGYVTLPEFGIDNAIYRVIAWEWDDNGPRLILREETADVWDVPGFVQASTAVAPAITFETPPTPSGLTATAVTDGISLKWTSPQPSTYETIEIHRADSGSPSIYTEIGQAVGFTYHDPVVDGATYDYKLRAKNAQGDVGSFSSNAIATARQVPTVASPGSGVPVYGEFNSTDNQHELNALVAGDGVAIEQDDTTGVITVSASSVLKNSLRLRSDVSSTSVSLADVSGMKFTLAENSVYEVRLSGLVQSANAGNGFKIGATAPSGTSLMTLHLVAPSTAETNGFTGVDTGTTSVSVTTSDVPVINSTYPFVATFVIVTGAESGSPSTGLVGDFQIQFGSEGAGVSVTLKQHSLMVLSKIDTQTSAATLTLADPGLAAAYTSEDSDPSFAITRLTMTYKTDGTYVIEGGTGDTVTGTPLTGNWGTPTTAGAGSDYEMMFDVTASNGVGTITNPAPSWTTLSSDLVFRLAVNSSGGTAQGTLTVVPTVRQRGTTTPTSTDSTSWTVTAIV